MPIDFLAHEPTTGATYFAPDLDFYQWHDLADSLSYRGWLIAEPVFRGDLESFEIENNCHHHHHFTEEPKPCWYLAGGRTNRYSSAKTFACWWLRFTRITSAWGSLLLGMLRLTERRCGRQSVVGRREITARLFMGRK